jgi:hypothetical protein
MINRPSLASSIVGRNRAANTAIKTIDDYLKEAAEVYAGEIKKLCGKKWSPMLI